MTFMQMLEGEVAELERKGKVVPGDVIQVSPTADVDPCWRAVFMMVEDVRDWGVMAYIAAPKAGLKDHHPARFYLRLNHKTESGEPSYFWIGPATYVPKDVAVKMGLTAEENSDD